jgi:hypothetical protein
MNFMLPSRESGCKGTKKSEKWKAKSEKNDSVTAFFRFFV